jgi:hypothetical protein
MAIPRGHAGLQFFTQAGFDEALLTELKVGASNRAEAHQS